MAPTTFLSPVPEKTSDPTPIRASNRQLTGWRKLSTKKGRREANEVILEGSRVVAEALAADVSVQAVLIVDEGHGHAEFRKLRPAIVRKSVAVYAVPARDFENLTDTVHAAGIACVIRWSPRPFDIREASRRHNRLLFCDRVSDPGNLGTLIRTAAGLGLDAVCLSPGTVELTNPKTLRATAGAIFRLPVYEGVAASAVLSWAKETSSALLIADAHQGESELAQTPARWALVIGGETIPLDEVWRSSGARWITLPLQRGVESLNAAVAGAILMDRLCRTPVVSPARKPPRRS